VVSEILDADNTTSNNNSSLRVNYSSSRKTQEQYNSTHHVCQQRSSPPEQRESGLIVHSILDIRSEMYEMTASLSLEKLTMNSIKVAAQVRKDINTKYNGTIVRYCIKYMFK
jgi:hypothetical protein